MNNVDQTIYINNDLDNLSLYYDDNKVLWILDGRTSINMLDDSTEHYNQNDFYVDFGDAYDTYLLLYENQKRPFAAVLATRIRSICLRHNRILHYARQLNRLNRLNRLEGASL